MADLSYIPAGELSKPTKEPPNPGPPRKSFSGGNPMKNKTSLEPTQATLRKRLAENEVQWLAERHRRADGIERGLERIGRISSAIHTLSQQVVDAILEAEGLKAEEAKELLIRPPGNMSTAEPLWHVLLFLRRADAMVWEAYGKNEDIAADLKRFPDIEPDPVRLQLDRVCEKLDRLQRRLYGTGT